MQEKFLASVLWNKTTEKLSKEMEAFFMAKFDNPLNNIRIASPCPANWDGMVGDERRRYCGECKLNVYNLSGMTRREAENLILDCEGRLCVRFYRRPDGTILTKDCPVGWQAIKRRVSKTAAAFASLVFAVLSGLGLNALFNQSRTYENSMGEIVVEYPPEPAGEIVGEAVMPEVGGIDVENTQIVGMLVQPGDEKQMNRKRQSR